MLELVERELYGHEVCGIIQGLTYIRILIEALPFSYLQPRYDYFFQQLNKYSSNGDEDIKEVVAQCIGALV